MIREKPRLELGEVLSGVGHDPVAPVALGAIERLIGALQDELWRIVANSSAATPTLAVTSRVPILSPA